MTPKACSLYDTIKLFKIKHGYTMEYCKIPTHDHVYANELAENGWIRMFVYPDTGIVIEILK